MKIYTLEAKNEVLSILTHENDISYREFNRMCLEANTEAENDFYTLKDILINDLGFKPVELLGGFEVSKRKGSL